VWEGERRLRLGGVKQRSLLALLLLRAGSVVPSDRLIEELWGDDRPHDAASAVHQHVARLRRLLEPHEALETRWPGYVLAIAPEQLDLFRFEQLGAEGRALLGEGRPEEAARRLRSALELWRGEPLADLTGERFLTSELPRLEETRLEVLEARLDADLASGRDRELIGELRELVRAAPFRERFRAQLMTALYRSGRQADALDVYAETRRELVDGLGLEPGPELQQLQKAILAHDAGLQAPARPAARAPGGRARAAAVGLVLALAVGVAAAVLLRDGDESRAGLAGAPTTGAVVAFDARSGALRRRIGAGRTPSSIAVHRGAAWVVDADAQTILRLSLASRVVETFSTGATPTDVAADAGSVWVANGRPLEDAQFTGPVATAVARLETTTGTKRAETRLPRRGGALSNLVENHVAAHKGAVWAVAPDYGIVRIDAATGAITARSRAVRAGAVAAGPAGVWVLGVDGVVARLDERSARPVARASVPASSVGAIAVGTDAAWVTSPSEGTLWKVAAGPGSTVGAIELARGVSDIAVAEDAVWVANPLAGTVVRVGVESAAVERTLDLEGIPRSIAVDGGILWVALVDDPEASAIAVSGIRPLPASTCEAVLAGKEDSDLLIVSDLPLQGGTRGTTTQMAQAIAFVLRERGFRAARFKVAYQSCDDSVARTGLFDEPKCAANARAYGRNPDIVAVIGTVNSPCAVAAIPELNRAPGGPLAMISPFNSFVGLTRGGPGVDPSLPAALYPTGRRNYVRVYPTDDLQGAALALVARDRGHRRVYVLDDGDPGYGSLMATGFETAAGRLGLEVAGRISWDPRAASYAALARRIARSGAEAIFVGGLLDTNAGQVVRDLRARLGPTVDILAPDGLTPLSLLSRRAGPSARGVYVSLAGTVTERLPPAGADFVRRFAKTQAGGEVEPSAVYAAEATGAVLDAIGRSDGTRDSVLEQLFATRAHPGLLGTFGFDANGDITESPVTIMRVTRGGRSRKIGSTEGGVVDRIVRPSPRLVATENSTG
jgi:branched-chain amino acid transport system substrate-binding protein